jgi:hypothetical protein
MADNDDDMLTPADAPAAASNDGTIEAMKQQILQLSEDLTALKMSVAERAEQVAENAAGWFDTASESASRATGALKSKAQTVSGIVQDNPGTVSSALLLGGIVGLLVGMALGRSEETHRRWYERH